jgi:hypothetical protein
MTAAAGGRWPFPKFPPAPKSAPPMRPMSPPRRTCLNAHDLERTHRHQPDQLDERRPALAGRRHAAGDRAVRRRQIGYEGFELGNKFPKDGPGLQRPSWRSSGWPACRAGTPASWPRTRSRPRSHAAREHMSQAAVQRREGGRLRRMRRHDPGPDRHGRWRAAPLHRRGPVGGLWRAAQCLRRAPAGHLRHHAGLPPSHGRLCRIARRHRRADGG